MNIFIRILKFVSYFRYHIVILASIILVGFVGENSYMSHLSHQRTIKQLQDEIVDYENQYQENTEKLKLMETDVEAIKEVARELYFMKAANEDVFIIKE